MLYRLLKSLPESTSRQLIGLFRVGNSGLADKLATAAAEPNSDDFHQMAKEEGLASIHAQLALRFVLLAADALVVALRQAGEEIAPDVEIDLASDVDALIAECAAAFPETNVDDFRIYLTFYTEALLGSLAFAMRYEYLAGDKTKLAPFFDLDPEEKKRLIYSFAAVLHSKTLCAELYALLLDKLLDDGRVPAVGGDPDHFIHKNAIFWPKICNPVLRENFSASGNFMQKNEIFTQMGYFSISSNVKKSQENCNYFL